MLSIFKHKLLISAALTIALPAFAQEITISAPQTTPQVLNGNTTLTITQSGSIVQSDDASQQHQRLVSTTGSANTVNNSGRIFTGTVEDAKAISSAATDDRINNLAGGRIETNGAFSYGIFSDNDAAIENSGTISVQGEQSVGVWTSSGTVANSGTISATGSYATGIYAERTSTLELQTGSTIEVTGSNSIVIKLNNENQLDAALGSTITARGENSAAIRLTGRETVGNTITLRGSISVNGPNATGVLLKSDDGGVSGHDVTLSGAIETLGDGAAGIRVYGANDSNAATFSNTITLDRAGVDAAIATSGAAAHGILTQDNADITADGNITTSGAGSIGVFARGNNNKITFNRAIATTGANADGIVLGSGSANVTGNQVTLSGTITTQGDNAAGIRVFGSNNTVRIERTATGENAIHTKGANAHGLDIANGNTIIVNGNIHTEGAGAIGFKAGNNNDITLNGTIRSNQSNSVKFGDGNTIRIGENVKLFGAVEIGGNTTYDPNDGPSMSRLIDLNTVPGGGGTGGGDTGGGDTGGGDTGGGGTGGGGTGGGGTGGSDTGGVGTGGGGTGGGTGGGGTGGVGTGGGVTIVDGDDKPVFQDPASGDIAEYDRTAVSTSTNQLAETSSAITGLGMARLRGTLPATSAAVENFTVAEPMQPGADPAEAAAEGASTYGGGGFGLGGSGLWLSGFAGVYNYGGDSVSLPTGVGLWGAAIGQDTILANGMRAGIFGGYSSASANAFDNGDLSVESEAEGYFAGAYGRAEIGIFFVDAAVSGGTNNHQNSRYIADGKLGEVAADAEYSSWWISPEIAAGADYAAGNGWTYSPNARLRYAFESFEGYTEKGPSTSNATLSQREAEIAEGRVEIAFARQMDDVLFSAQLGWLQRWGMGEGEADISVFGVSKTLAVSSPDASAGYAGAGFDIAVAEGLLINLSGEATFGSDITGGRFDAGIRANF